MSFRICVSQSICKRCIWHMILIFDSLMYFFRHTKYKYCNNKLGGFEAKLIFSFLLSFMLRLIKSLLIDCTTIFSFVLNNNFWKEEHLTKILWTFVTIKFLSKTFQFQIDSSFVRSNCSFGRTESKCIWLNVASRHSFFWNRSTLNC